MPFVLSRIPILCCGSHGSAFLLESSCASPMQASFLSFAVPTPTLAADRELLEWQQQGAGHPRWSMPSWWRPGMLVWRRYIESKRSSMRIHSTLRQGEECETACRYLVDEMKARLNAQLARAQSFEIEVFEACTSLSFFFHVTSRTVFYSVPVAHRVF